MTYNTGGQSKKKTPAQEAALKRAQAMQAYYKKQQQIRSLSQNAKDPTRSQGSEPRRPSFYEQKKAKKKYVARRNESIIELAKRAGVAPKDITSQGVKKLVPGMSVDVSKAQARREQAENIARMRQDELEKAREIQAQGKPEGRLQGPGAKERWEGQQAYEQAIRTERDVLAGKPIAGVPTQEPEPFLPQRDSVYRMDQPAMDETITSKVVRGVQEWRQDIGILGVDVPDKQYYEGMSPDEIRREKLMARGRAMNEYYGLPAEAEIPPASPEQAQEYKDLIERGNFDDVFAATVGGTWVTDATGKKIFISNSGTGVSQRVIDAQGAKLSAQSIAYALERQDWSLLPTSISAGAAQHMVGTPYGLTPEEMSLLGYSQDEWGNWVHEVMEEPTGTTGYSSGYSGYGDYGGYGGYGGYTPYSYTPTEYEPNKNTYAGGRAQQLSGRFAKREGERANAAGMGAVNWRI